jgi:phosphohistidine phosphatase
MRRLMLLRHAKALPAKGGKDIDRPLSEEGREEAQVVGQYMAAEGLDTTMALISPAERARQTFDLVDNFLTSSPKMRVEPKMYEASWVSLFALVRKMPVKQTSLLLVGHNPGFEDLANELIGSGSKTAISRFARRMATGALAVIDFDTKGWSRIKALGGHLSYFESPDDLFALEK